MLSGGREKERGRMDKRVGGTDGRREGDAQNSWETKVKKQLYKIHVFDKQKHQKTNPHYTTKVSCFDIPKRSI